MTDEEIIKGLDLACSSITGSFMWTANPFPILRDYIHRLQSENAALRERLERTVELPCGVGDKVYCIHRISNPEILEWQVNEIHITDHNYMLQLGHAGTKDYKNEASQFYGKWWFTELEAAEACLSELKGGKER